MLTLALLPNGALVDDCHSQEGSIHKSLVSYQHGFSSCYCHCWRYEQGLPFLSPLSLNHELRTITPLLQGKCSLYLFGFYSNAAEIPGLLQVA